MKEHASAVIFPPETILVIGHRNPDTDASASAYGYAEFLGRNGNYESPVVAAVPGALTPQSRHVFERAGLPPPSYLESLLPRVCDVCTRKVDSISTSDRFRDAIEMLIRTNRSMLPVIGSDGRLHSIFSHRRDVSRFLFGLDVIPILGRLLTWSDLVELPGARPIGRRPENPEISGQVHLALAGNDGWRERIGPDDLLVCGELAVALSLPADRFPRWIVLISNERDLEPAGAAAAGERGAALLAYRHSALDFLCALTSQIRVGALELGAGPCVGEFDFLKDVQEMILGSRHAMPVLDSESRLAGVISRDDIVLPPRRRVILIDHFESGQTVAGIEHAEILEIVDHHRVGDIETPGPVRVDCRPLGSSSTIVAMRFFEMGLQPDRATASLLLGGLAADTLGLRGPTATAVDRKVGSRLAEIAGVSLEAFSLDVLRAGDDLLTADPAAIWNRDQKVFSIRNHTFAVAQLETVSLEEIPPERLQALRSLLERDFAGGGHLLSLLFLTDVLAGNSWFTSCEAPEVRGLSAACFGLAGPRPGWTLAPGLVSRKKQILPRLIRTLAEWPS